MDRWKMEEGKTYTVFYKDDERVRKKELIFKEESQNFVTFSNPMTGQEENIPIMKVIRIVGEDGK